jgi:hypothetical protein
MGLLLFMSPTQDVLDEQPRYMEKEILDEFLRGRRRGGRRNSRTLLRP